MSTGWLVGQLPRAMAADPVIAGVAGICEEIADTLRAGVDGIGHHLDLATSPDPMVRYLASWVGADLDPGISLARQQELLRATGPLLSRRGTRYGLELLLEALTGSRVRVGDGGGVFAEDRLPPPDPRVLVEIDDPGELSAQQLLTMIGAEVPVGTVVELRIAGRPVGEQAP
ncbi:MAG TPA: phage tail protein [Kineosporiaceae bacterium]|nr:phage tail protein [Kineosporiaceae bacterium]